MTFIYKPDDTGALVATSAMCGRCTEVRRRGEDAPPVWQAKNSHLPKFCTACGGEIAKGDAIVRDMRKGFMHPDCRQAA